MEKNKPVKKKPIVGRGPMKRQTTKKLENSLNRDLELYSNAFGMPIIGTRKRSMKRGDRTLAIDSSNPPKKKKKEINA